VVEAPIETDAERKQVTVLFADVKGSMDLAEQRDPEEWREMMQRFFSILADAVRHFEGTVDKFTGDGIMAIFGAPVAHEDHARRACYAALRMLDDVGEYAGELRRRHGLNFSVRIGINSGEVVTGAIGEGGDGEYTAIGHTVGLAQRMEALAESGKAYLAEAAADLAHGFLELEDLGEFEIKGASRPVRVFELAGVGSARSRLDLSRERGFSRFVGRAEEMAVLERALERAEAGDGSVVGIVADPGVGKSRLCHELAEHCRGRGIEVYESQAQAHGQAVPFMPVLQMLRAYFGIEDRDNERTARERIAGRMLLLDPDLFDDLPLLFDFLGVPDPDRPAPQISPEARERALRGIVRKLVRAPNRRDVVVSVVEDLHWMDEGSGAFLAEMAEAVAGTRTLLVLNFRPEYSAEWMKAPAYLGVPLVPLGREHTRELLRDLVGEDPSLDGLDELVHERTAGNPFFVEEMVRELVEAGDLAGERGAYRLVRPVGEMKVPASVQAVLAARIDRLDKDAKRLLQVGSVIGKESSEAALRAVAGEVSEDDFESSLAKLIEAGFLYEAELYPQRLLAFRHPLTQEVAYGTQLSGQRAATHAATARAMVELNAAERHDELAALIAQHFEAGEEPLEAARWSARAAHWAGYSHPHDAQRLWSKVTELVDGLEESEETATLAVYSRLLQVDYGWRLGMPVAEADALASDAAAIAKRIGDLRSLALLQMLTSARPGVVRHADEWTAGAGEATRIADESGDRDLRVAMRAAGAYAYLCAGRYGECERMVDESLELADDDPASGAGIIIGCPAAWCYMAKAIVLSERDRLEEADNLLAKGLRIATDREDTETASWIRGMQSRLLWLQGDADSAVALAQRNCELAERLGDVFSRTLALGNMALSRIASGDHDGAIDAIVRAQRLYHSAIPEGGEGETWRAAVHAEALLGAGRGQEALEQAEHAAARGRKEGMHWSLPGALRVLGLARAASGVQGSETALDEAEAIARGTGSELSLRSVEEAREEIGAGAPG
jgi:class 3 adenylate cyclase/tetratricopeptide (TPR) repeat protein